MLLVYSASFINMFFFALMYMRGRHTGSQMSGARGWEIQDSHLEEENRKGSKLHDSLTHSYRPLGVNLCRLQTSLSLTVLFRATNSSSTPSFDSPYMKRLVCLVFPCVSCYGIVFDVISSLPLQQHQANLSHSSPYFTHSAVKLCVSQMLQPVNIAYRSILV